MVNRLIPEFFVMENVPGILTMRKGDAIKEIIEAFTEIGYRVNVPIKLNAEEFGVPQRRKRVFIIGSLEEISIPQPSPLFYMPSVKTPNMWNLPVAITVRDAIGSLPELENGEEVWKWIMSLCRHRLTTGSCMES